MCAYTSQWSPSLLSEVVGRGAPAGRADTVLSVEGEQARGKTTGTRTLAALLDPVRRRPASRHGDDTQKEAIGRAREIVQNVGGGEVVIHDHQGNIRDSLVERHPEAVVPALAGRRGCFNATERASRSRLGNREGGQMSAPVMRSLSCCALSAPSIGALAHSSPVRRRTPGALGALAAG